ncbi:Hsp33 family molecular chaperone [Salaquimonas pukyongi]|uniref:Hsp33 family molecular chaperone n=1 Tax=Salaquimonas pukyongi TaxID=2712698 RepID=UPI00096B8AEC|nr:Hsp33 family molecular chaperone [Salaquimonas pukyongi]
MTQDTPQTSGLAGIDSVLPFHVPALDVRGRAVQLGPMLSSILDRHDYPEPVSRLLGEVIVLTVLLGSSLKFDGRFTIQTQTDGPVSLLVVDFKTPGAVRAYASFDADAVAKAQAATADSPEDLLGKGILAMTIDQGAHTQRYQGIVELSGTSLEEVAQAYFRQSEQIPTHVRIAVSRLLIPDIGGQGSSQTWQGGGVLVQFLPETQERYTVRDLPGGDAPQDADEPQTEETDEAWVEARILTETIRDDELTDPEISSERLLYRLFHEQGVRVHEASLIEDKCSCNREKILDVLKSLPQDELGESWQDGQIITSCEFCSTVYTVKPGDLE